MFSCSAWSSRLHLRADQKVGGSTHSRPDTCGNAPTVPGDPPAVVSDAELRALLKACEGSRLDAVVTRRCSVSSRHRRAFERGRDLRMIDVDVDTRRLEVLGKGERVRVLYMPLRAGSLRTMWRSPAEHRRRTAHTPTIRSLARRSARRSAAGKPLWPQTASGPGLSTTVTV